MQTEWREIPGFESLYEISNTGKCRRAMNYVRPKKANTRVYPGSPLKQHKSKDGYPLYALWKDGKCAQIKTHRLVAAAFLGPVPDGMEVHHKDENKCNNSPSNLEYVTHIDNMHDYYIRDPRRMQRDKCTGEKHWNAKLNPIAVAVIRFFRGKISQPIIAKVYGVNRRTIIRVQHNQNWRAVDC